MHVTRQRGLTKENILQASLALFSEYGYDGTGMDAIAAKVGIKAPSLYKHFAGKEDILSELLGRMEAAFADLWQDFDMNREDPSADVGTWTNAETWISRVLENLRRLAKDETLRQMRRVLLREQYTFPKAAALSAALFDAWTSYYARLFAALYPRMSSEEAYRTAAWQFLSPIAVWMAQWDVMPAREETYLRLSEQHFRQFRRLLEERVEAGNTRATPVGRSLPVSLM